VSLHGHHNLRVPHQPHHSDTICDLDWTTTPDLQSILAIGFADRVEFLCEKRMDYAVLETAWETLYVLSVNTSVEVDCRNTNVTSDRIDSRLQPDTASYQRFNMACRRFVCRWRPQWNLCLPSRQFRNGPRSRSCAINEPLPRGSAAKRTSGRLSPAEHWPVPALECVRWGWIISHT
jgi:hypothetical protein